MNYAKQIAEQLKTRRIYPDFMVPMSFFETEKEYNLEITKGYCTLKFFMRGENPVFQAGVPGIDAVLTETVMKPNFPPLHLSFFINSVIQDLTDMEFPTFDPMYEEWVKTRQDHIGPDQFDTVVVELLKQLGHVYYNGLSLIVVNKEETPPGYSPVMYADEYERSELAIDIGQSDHLSYATMTFDGDVKVIEVYLGGDPSGRTLPDHQSLTTVPSKLLEELNKVADQYFGKPRWVAPRY